MGLFSWRSVAYWSVLPLITASMYASPHPANGISGESSLSQSIFTNVKERVITSLSSCKIQVKKAVFNSALEEIENSFINLTGDLVVIITQIESTPNPEPTTNLTLKGYIESYTLRVDNEIKNITKVLSQFPILKPKVPKIGAAIKEFTDLSIAYALAVGKNNSGLEGGNEDLIALSLLGVAEELSKLFKPVVCSSKIDQPWSSLAIYTMNGTQAAKGVLIDEPINPSDPELEAASVAYFQTESELLFKKFIKEIKDCFKDCFKDCN